MSCLPRWPGVAGSGDLRRVAPAGREGVRLRVVAALESGRVKGYRQAAEVFQVAERSVGEATPVVWTL